MHVRTQGVMVQPVGKDGVIVAGTDTVRACVVGISRYNPETAGARGVWARWASGPEASVRRFRGGVVTAARSTRGDVAWGLGHTRGMDLKC